MYFWPIFDLLSGRCPQPIFDLLLSYTNSSGDLGGLRGPEILKLITSTLNYINCVRTNFVRVGFNCLRLGLSAYGWSLLLTVEIQLALFLLSAEFSFGLFAYGGKSFWYFLLAGPPVQRLDLVFSTYRCPQPEIGFGLFLLTASPP